MSFWQLLPATCDANFASCCQMRQKSFLWKATEKVSNTKEKLETKSKSQSKQTFLQLNLANFKKLVVSSFLAADIPLHKLNHPSLKFLFAAMVKYCLRRLQPGHVLLN